MTTVTLQLDEELLAKARAMAKKKQASVDEIVAEEIAQLPEEDPAAGFLEMVEEFRAKGITLPILSREERNARR